MSLRYKTRSPKCYLFLLFLPHFRALNVCIRFVAGVQNEWHRGPFASDTQRGAVRHRASKPSGSSRGRRSEQVPESVPDQTTHGLRDRSLPASEPAHLLLSTGRRLSVPPSNGSLCSRRCFTVFGVDALVAEKTSQLARSHAWPVHVTKSDHRDCCCVSLKCQRTTISLYCTLRKK